LAFLEIDVQKVLLHVLPPGGSNQPRLPFIPERIYDKESRTSRRLNFLNLSPILGFAEAGGDFFSSCPPFCIHMASPFHFAGSELLLKDFINLRNAEVELKFYGNV
jgi:hypothetical protein